MKKETKTNEPENVFELMARFNENQTKIENIEQVQIPKCREKGEEERLKNFRIIAGLLAEINDSLSTRINELLPNNSVEEVSSDIIQQIMKKKIQKRKMRSSQL